MPTQCPNSLHSNASSGPVVADFVFDIPVSKIEWLIGSYRLAAHRDEFFRVVRRTALRFRLEAGQQAARRQGIAPARQFNRTRKAIQRALSDLNNSRHLNRLEEAFAATGQALPDYVDFEDQLLMSPVEFMWLSLLNLEEMYAKAEAYKEAPGQRQAPTEVRFATERFWSFWKDTLKRNTALNDWEGNPTEALVFLLECLDLIGCKATADTVKKFKLK